MLIVAGEKWQEEVVDEGGMHLVEFDQQIDLDRAPFGKVGDTPDRFPTRE